MLFFRFQHFRLATLENRLPGYLVFFGDKEERTKNIVMAAVGDNIRTLHSRLAERGADCTLEWNSGGHFKDADLRTAKAFRWVMEEHA